MSRELDSIIERQLSVLEHTLPSANSRFLFTLGMHGKFSLASAALAFHGLRETTSEKGRVFADRAEMLVAKMKANYPQVNFAGVTDFYLRQAKVTFEGELAEIREMTEMMDLDGKEEERDARTKKAVTIEEQLEIVKKKMIMLNMKGKEVTKEEGEVEMGDGIVDNPTMSPFQPSLPISIRIRSIETANLSFVAKFRTPPFTLLFDTVNQTYRLEESADPTGRLLHHIGPYNLGYVAYCPGSEFVHTRSLDYVMKRKAKLDRGPEIEGGFVNLNCENGQEAEDLVTHFEERRMEWVKISRVSRARLDDMQAGRE